ncbi:MAG: glutamyl-tRNA reductase [Proteobacteria bacterium]|nr:glutamyl-tRNA reductase [Pseudomonadota bacterium]
MHIVVFGLNHNTAPIDIREKLYIPEESIPDTLSRIKTAGIHEAVIVSTCNRTEIYFCTNDQEESLNIIHDTLFIDFSIKQDWISNYTYCFEDEDAYRHLFLVASGLDSMVIGEPQILGQIKDAYRTATLQNATGFFLDKTFHKTFNVAKRIRTETRIGYNPISISSMAIELSKNIFGELHKKKILVIGVGEMCEIALKYFRKEGLNEIFIANRTFQHAQNLSEEIIGTPCLFQEIPELLTKVDMVLSSTGSEKPIIDKTLVHTVMKKRKNKPLFFIDIALPRDVDPEVNDFENVYLYDIDDLKELSQKHISDRVKESEKAMAIIDEEKSNFTAWLNRLDVNPLITHIIGIVDETREKELRKITQKLKNADEETLKLIDILTKNIVNKLIHPHISMIKKNEDPVVIDIIKKIFSFEVEDENKMDSGHERE